MGVENIEDQESLKNYQQIKKQLEQALNEVQQTSDLRAAKGLLIEVQNSFKGLQMAREDRDELYSQLQNAFALVNQKIEEERNSFNNEAQQNYLHIRQKVEEALFLASNPRDFKETWEFLLEVQTLFKGVRLLREHRESLYAQLQQAFEKVKGLKDIEKAQFENQSAQSYLELNQHIEVALEKASQTDDFRFAKDLLIQAQGEMRNVSLTKEKREELYSKLQDGFTTLSIRQEEIQQKSNQEADRQFDLFRPMAEDLLKRSQESFDFHLLRTDLKDMQAEIRDSMLSKDQKDSLRDILQEAFETFNRRQDEERTSFETEAQKNYQLLKSKVNDGYLQAEQTSEYKETREYLKMIQGMFKGIRMVREQREELYARLQLAFEILNRRVDEYFIEKKKNWELRMQYKQASLSTDLFNLRQSIENDLEALQELEDQLVIVLQTGKESSAVVGLKARVSSMRIHLERKETQLKNMEAEMAELQKRLTPLE